MHKLTLYSIVIGVGTDAAVFILEFYLLTVMFSVMALFPLFKMKKKKVNFCSFDKL